MQRCWDFRRPVIYLLITIHLVAYYRREAAPKLMVYITGRQKIRCLVAGIEWCAVSAKLPYERGRLNLIIGYPDVTKIYVR